MFLECLMPAKYEGTAISDRSQTVRFHIIWIRRNPPIWTRGNPPASRLAGPPANRIPMLFVSLKLNPTWVCRHMWFYLPKTSRKYCIKKFKKITSNSNSNGIGKGLGLFTPTGVDSPTSVYYLQKWITNFPFFQTFSCFPIRLAPLSRQ